jgi:hypothetical protein
MTFGGKARISPCQFNAFGMAAGMFVAVLGAAFSVSAQEEDRPYSIEASAGFRYDNNITVDEIDTTTRIGDTSYLFRAAFGADIFQSKKSSLTARYSFSQSLHRDLSDFDLQIQGLTLQAKTKAGKVNLAAEYRYNFITLGGKDFLEIQAIRPNLGFLAAKKLYMTTSYEYRKHTFKDVTAIARNAQRHTGAAKAFFLLGKGKNITLGYKLARHRTSTDDLSYWGNTVDLGYKVPVKIFGGKLVYRLRYQYRQRDYFGIDTSIGVVRADKRHMVRTSLDIPYAEKFNARFEYKYVNSISNLPSIDYASHVLTFRIGWEL